VSGRAGSTEEGTGWFVGGGKGGSSTIVNGMVQTREGQMDGVGVGGRAIRTELEEMVS
jgi:hypothetical protein